MKWCNPNRLQYQNKHKHTVHPATRKIPNPSANPFTNKPISFNNSSYHLLISLSTNPPGPTASTNFLLSLNHFIGQPNHGPTNPYKQYNLLSTIQNQPSFSTRSTTHCLVKPNTNKNQVEQIKSVTIKSHKPDAPSPQSASVSSSLYIYHNLLYVYLYIELQYLYIQMYLANDSISISNIHLSNVLMTYLHKIWGSKSNNLSK